MTTDDQLVTQLLGRSPMGEYRVAVRRDDGSPVVIENAPLFDNGRPMPTRFWLADRVLCREIGRLEAEGGVNRAEAEIGLEVIASVHETARIEREEILGEHDGPSPSGGVGGTRIGVKCLHAHYANHLAGADDAVGRWVEDRLGERGAAYDRTRPGIASDGPDRVDDAP